MFRLVILFGLLFLALPGYTQVLFSATPVSATVTHKTSQSESASVVIVYNVKNTTNPTTGAAYACGTDYQLQPTGSKIDIRSGTLATGSLVATIVPTLAQSVCVSSTGGFNVTVTINLTNVTTNSGVFTIWPTLNVNDIRGVRTALSTPTNSSFVLGYQAEWGDVSDMSISGSTCTRNSPANTSLTYGIAQVTNQLETGDDGVFQIGAQLPGTTGSVYAIIGARQNLNSFATTPTSDRFYLLFNKTSSTASTVSLVTSTATTQMTGVTIADRILIRRTGSLIQFYKNNLSTLITGLPSVTLNGQWNLSVASAAASNGVTGVIVSPAPAFRASVFANLERELRGVDYPCGEFLNFSYIEEYDPASSSLNYRILNSLNQPVQGFGTLLTTGVTSVSATRSFGDNRYNLPVSGLYRGTYILEVVNDKNERFYLRFTKSTGIFPPATLDPLPEVRF